MKEIDRYLLFGLPKVGGWLEPTTAEFIATISSLQHQARYSGAVGEIGVHHGKLLILLRLAADRDERVFAIDVFEDQSLNVDGSGHGDRQILEDNLKRWCGSAQNVSIIAKSSLDVTPDELLATCGRVRLVSIDGGHTAECTYNDLKLIEAVAHDYVVVALDDYFNEDWPDVSTNAARYMSESNTRLRPFAITPNKIFLTTPEYNEAYRLKLATHTPFRSYKTSEMFGSKVDVFHGPRAQPPLGHYIRLRVRSSAIGPYLLFIKGAIGQRLGRR